MDEWSLALLSCKLNLIGVEPGGIIKRRGDNSEYAYILLGGAAKVRLVLWVFSGCFLVVLALASRLGSGARAHKYLSHAECSLTCGLNDVARGRSKRTPLRLRARRAAVHRWCKRRAK
jgi:hypothetical protein